MNCATGTGTETLRPSLAALSTRLASAATPTAPKSLYTTPSNTTQQVDVGYDHHDEAATPTLRIDEYATTLSVNSGSELTRRPSVAIGGVRSPNSTAPVTSMTSMTTNSAVGNAPTSFDSGVYTSADERDSAGGHAAHVTSAAGQLERGRSSLRRGPMPSVRYTGGGVAGVAGVADTNNPSYNFQQVGL